MTPHPQQVQQEAEALVRKINPELDPETVRRVARKVAKAIPRPMTPHPQP
jgi:hypothetical protein